MKKIILEFLKKTRPQTDPETTCQLWGIPNLYQTFPDLIGK